jgi:glycosyltransferase involved in cell wall biosynthesis
MRATVLICTHDRRALMRLTLASLNAALRPAGWELDILVAANACSDGTHEMLEGYREACAEKGWLPLTWFAEPTPGKSHALNSALPRIDGDLVAFVDDDHRVDASYLHAVCEAAAAWPDVDLFCGRILPDWDGTEPAWVHDRGPYRIYPLPVPRFDLGPEPLTLDGDGAIPGGGNLVARTRLLPKVGPFHTDYGPSGHDLGGAEDLEWVRRALGTGARLQYLPRILQYHYVDNCRLTLGYLMRKAYMRSASTVRLDPKCREDTFIPPFMVRKALGYAGLLLISWSWARLRFHLVRLAAAVGEIKGHLQARGDQRRAQSHPAV